MDSNLYFKQHAIALFEGIISRDAERELYNWVKEDDAHKQLLRDWDATWQEQSHSNPRVEVLWQDFQRKVSNQNQKVVPLWYRSLVRWAAVSCFFAFFIAYVFVTSQRPAPPDIAFSPTIIQTTNNVTCAILPDSSQVVLNMGSKLRWVDNRYVELTGEAWFEVKSDTAHPFVVKLNNMEVWVTGTQFNVSAYDNEQEQVVSLYEGRVHVRCANQQVLLHPSEQARLINGTCELKVSQCDAMAAGLWREGKMDYESIALDELLMRLSRMYHVEIEVDKKRDWKSVRFVMYEQHDLYDILLGMEETYGIHVEKKGRGYRVN